MKRALLLLVFALGLLAVDAAAQSRPELTSRADADVVAVGDEFHLFLQAMAGDTLPTDPSPGSTKGFQVEGMSSGPSQSITIANGRVTQKSGLNVTWTLRAEKAGSYTLGPASVMVGTTRYAAQPVRIHVVGAGQAPQRGGGNPFAPFDPFKGLFDTFGEPGISPQQDVPVDPRLGLDAPRAPYSFLHATIDKTSAVVGEQVTLSVFLYVDLGEREADITDVHEATADDFVKRPLFDDEGTAKSVGNALIGGRVWGVKLVRKSALFPLKTGDLDIGPMSLTLVRSRLQGDPHRLSEPLRVHVTEPPSDGRPPGYELGNVGDFSMTADVTPRDVEQDGAVGVTVDLTGTGNVPGAVTPPARAGIEWLPPEIHDKLGAAQGDKFGGKRTFSFVVRLRKPGDIDLGELSVPFWNPDTRTYAVAHAALGAVHVKPGAGRPAEEAQFDPFANLPAPQLARMRAQASRAHLADTPVFWLGLGVAPLAYVFAAGAWAAAASYRRKRGERKASPEAELKERMAAADDACRNGDPKLAYAAIVRALEGATIARRGVNVRDAQSGEVSRRLSQAGVSDDAARLFEELLRACEAARFSPEAGDGRSVPDRWAQAKRAIASLKADAPPRAPT